MKAEISLQRVREQIAKLKLWDAIEITWIDIVDDPGGPHETWIEVGELEKARKIKPHTTRCTFLKLDEPMLVGCSDKTDDDPPLVCGTHYFPIGCLLKVRKLR